MTSTLLRQTAFRGRNDTQTLNSGTFDYNQNTNWSQNVDTTFRVRLEMAEVNNKNFPISSDWIEAQVNGGGYFQVTTSSSIVKAVNSSQFSQGDATTDVLTVATQTFTAGQGVTTGTYTVPTSLQNLQTEHEFCLQIVGADVNNGDIINVRYAALTEYAVTPAITVVKAVWTPASSNKSAYVKGRSTSLSNKSAFVKGGIIATPSSKSAYTRGGILATPTNKSAYIHGLSYGLSNKSAFINGSITIISNKSAYVNGMGGGISNKNAFVAGKDYGLSSKSVYLEGKLGASDSHSAYIGGMDSGVSNKSAFIQGKDYSTDNKNSYIEGQAGQPVDNRHAFVQGLDYSLDNKHSFVQGKEFAVDNKHVYLKGGIESTSNISAYTEGYMSGGDALDSKHAFLLGIDSLLVPDGDLGSVGNWLNELNSPTNLYQSIDESYPDDNDYVWNTDPQDVDYIEFSLSNPAGNIGDGDVVILFRIRDKSGSASFGCWAFLYQGVTEIANSGYTLPNQNTYTFYFTLSPAEKASITDWNDLRIRILIDMS